jgi:hypothetical protein
MGRGPLVGASRDGGSANDLDRYDRESDKTIRRRRDRDGATGRAEARALVRVLRILRVLRRLRMARSGHVVPRHRVHVRHHAVVHRTMMMAKRLGRREHKRETDEERAQPSPDHCARIIVS